MRCHPARFRTRSGRSPRPSSTADPAAAPTRAPAPGPGRHTACRVRCIRPWGSVTAVGTGWARHGDPPRPGARPGSGAARRRRLAQHRRPAAQPGRPSRPDRRSSTSGPSAASTACTSWTSCARSRSGTPTCWSSSACTRRSSRTRPTTPRSPPRSSATSVHHPVLDDPELATWQQYAVRAWPTLVVVDPEGYVVSRRRRRGPRATRWTGSSRSWSPSTRPSGTLRRGDGPYVPPPAADDRAALPRQVSPLRRPARCWSPTPATTRWSSSAPTARPCCAASARGERGRADGGPDEAQLRRAAGAHPAAADGRRDASATTSWSPTPSTT